MEERHSPGGTRGCRYRLSCQIWRTRSQWPLRDLAGRQDSRKRWFESSEVAGRCERPTRQILASLRNRYRDQIPVACAHPRLFPTYGSARNTRVRADSGKRDRESPLLAWSELRYFKFCGIGIGDWIAVNTGKTASGRRLDYRGDFFRISSSHQWQREGDVFGGKALSRSTRVRNVDRVRDSISRQDSIADIGIDGNAQPLFNREELPQFLQHGLRDLVSGKVAHPEMARVGVVRRGCVLVDLRLEPFVITREAAGRSAGIRERRRVALSAAGLGVEFLSWCRERRNRRAPHASLRGLRKARQIGGNLTYLLIIQILVRHKCGHCLSCPLTNDPQELSRAQLMAGERLRESALSLLAVTACNHSVSRNTPARFLCRPEC